LVDKQRNAKKLSAKALFEIIKIHVELRDFYEANYQLDRAFHFGYHKKCETDQQSEEKSDNQNDVPDQLLIYRKLVQAVILLMKRKFEAAMTSLKEIDQSHKVQGKQGQIVKF